MVSNNYCFQIDSPLVQKVWQENANYMVEYDDQYLSQKFCAVYFSGHSIYFPNNTKAFCESIIERNRYEWYGNRIPNTYKHIFVRDIHKQWYLSGINSFIDSPESLLELLRNLTKGYKIVTVGSSAGGYAAILYGTLLGAERVFAFSPRMEMHSLENSSPSKVPLYYKFKNTERNKYMDLGHLLDFSKSNVFCFYPTKSHLDKIQLDYISNLSEDVRKELHIIKFNTKKHGVPFPKVVLPRILRMGNGQLVNMKETLQNPLLFSIEQIGLYKTIQGICSQYYQSLKNRKERH